MIVIIIIKPLYMILGVLSGQGRVVCMNSGLRFGVENMLTSSSPQGSLKVDS